jgi:hypothetical protein
MVIIGNDIGLNNNAIVVCTHHEGKLTVIDKYYVNLSKYKSEGYKLQQLYQQYLDVFSKYVNPVIVYEHPVMKGKFDKVLPGISNAQIVVKPAHFSHFYYRNLGYNQSLYASKKATTVLYWMYVFYFLTRFKFKELAKFIAFFKDGTLNKFDRK